MCIAFVYVTLVPNKSYVMQCRELLGKDFPVYVCHWHVKPAGLKNLLAKCGTGTLKPIFGRLSQIMAMLKQHEESDVAFLVRVKQCTQQLYADQKAFVDYLNDQWTLDSKLCKLQTVRCISWLHKQYQLFLVSVSAFVAECIVKSGSSTVQLEIY